MRETCVKILKNSYCAKDTCIKKCLRPLSTEKERAYKREKVVNTVYFKTHYKIKPMLQLINTTIAVCFTLENIFINATDVTIIYMKRKMIDIKFKQLPGTNIYMYNLHVFIQKPVERICSAFQHFYFNCASRSSNS